MNLSLQVIAKPVVSGLSVVGNYFNSPNRFISTFNIAGLVAEEWAYRFPNHHSNLNVFVDICSSFNIRYLGECLSLPSRFLERREGETKNLKAIIELNKVIVITSSFLYFLNQAGIINLSKWAVSIGKISGLGWINQLNMAQGIVFGCISYSLLSVIHFSKEVLNENEIGACSKKNWYSLGQSLIETNFYAFLFLAPKYRLLNQPVLVRAVIIAKEVFSGIVLDFVKSK